MLIGTRRRQSRELPHPPLAPIAGQWAVGGLGAGERLGSGPVHDPVGHGTNICNEAQTLDDSAQFVFERKGTGISSDSEADIVINGSKNGVFFNQITPSGSREDRVRPS